MQSKRARHKNNPKFKGKENLSAKLSLDILKVIQMKNADEKIILIVSKSATYDN